MSARAVILAFVAGCYAPHAVPGAPCMPQIGCPEPQTCALVDGAYVCVEGAGADAATSPDGPARDARVDAPGDGPQAPRWALVQTKATSMPAVTIAPSGAGHLIVVGVETNSTDTVAMMADDANNAYVAVPNAHAINAVADLGVELWYAKNSKAGATTIAVDGVTIRAVVMWEVSGIRTTNPLDRAAVLDDQPTSTTPVGASLTTTAPGELVISAAIVQHAITGLHAGSEFTNDHSTLGNGWAHLTSTTAPAGPHQATWDQPTTGVSCASSASFLVGP